MELSTWYFVSLINQPHIGFNDLILSQNLELLLQRLNVLYKIDQLASFVIIPQKSRHFKVYPSFKYGNTKPPYPLVESFLLTQTTQLSAPNSEILP